MLIIGIFIEIYLIDLLIQQFLTQCKSVYSQMISQYFKGRKEIVKKRIEKVYHFVAEEGTYFSFYGIQQNNIIIMLKG